MGAAPAWPPDSAPRLFVDHPLTDGGAVRVVGMAANYLLNVMRLTPGGQVKLFDDVSGEWLAQVEAAGKRDAVLRVIHRLRPREPVPDLWLLAAPIRRARTDWVAEKACELGVARLVPVLMRRAVVDKVNLNRQRAHMIEAAEQCGRTALPELAAPVALADLLRDWPSDRALLFADEAGGVALGEVVGTRPGPAAILIGPEGGFAPEERAAIATVPQAVRVSLGPRILRADTAAIAAVALWMAAAGDWRAT